MPPSEATAKPQQHSFWIAVISGAVILTIGIGARQRFGIFQKPIAADLKVGRELWSFANALAMLLMGAFSPFRRQRRGSFWHGADRRRRWRSFTPSAYL